MDEEQKKIKAIDINTESLKLYVAIAIASIAGLISYHNSNNINHNEFWFSVSLLTFILSGVSSLMTLNSYITLVDSGTINVGNKLSVVLNFIAIVLFVLGLIFGCIYFVTSEAKLQTDKTKVNTEGISIHGNDIIIGNDVKTNIKITKDSTGAIKEILIPNSEQ